LIFKDVRVYSHFKIDLLTEIVQVPSAKISLKGLLVLESVALVERLPSDIAEHIWFSLY
jgi:hypothetical protein